MHHSYFPCCRWSLYSLCDVPKILLYVELMRMWKKSRKMTWQRIHVNFYFAVNAKPCTTLGQSCWDWVACKIGAFLIFLVDIGAFIAYVMYQKYCCMQNLCEFEKRQEKWLEKLHVDFYVTINSKIGPTLGQSSWDWRACKIGACIILIFLVAVGAFIAYVMYQKYCCWIKKPQKIPSMTSVVDFWGQFA